VISEIGIDLYSQVYDFLKSSPSGVGESRQNVFAASVHRRAFLRQRVSKLAHVTLLSSTVAWSPSAHCLAALTQAESKAKSAELLRIVGGNKQLLATCFLIDCLVYDESLCE
jgi:hypothetical protein